MKNSFKISIAIAIILFCVGLFFPIPDKELSVGWSNDTGWGKAGTEYVGGDAYNYQMEASLTAGWVSGVMAFKGIMIASGAILFSITLMLNDKNNNPVIKKIENTNNDLPEI